MLPAGRDEEPINAMTHALGLAGALAGGVVLLSAAARNGGTWQIAGCAAYTATLVATYAASTLSHVFRRPGLRRAFRAADQAVIFLFVAGTWTPVAFTWLRAGPWWILHGLIWAVALAGFASKAVFSHRVDGGDVATGLYVLLGWMPVAFAWPLLRVLPGGLMLWFLAGGICYTAGIVFFHYDDRVPYFHAAWHLLVVAGSACHFVGVLHYCTTNPV